MNIDWVLDGNNGITDKSRSCNDDIVSYPENHLILKGCMLKQWAVKCHNVYNELSDSTGKTVHIHKYKEHL